MTSPSQSDAGGRAEPGDANAIEPLPGEHGIPDVATAKTSRWSRKGLMALVLLIASLVAVAGLSIGRFAASVRKPLDDSAGRVGDRPAAATTEPRRLDMSAAPAASAAAAATPPRIPALRATNAELAAAEPIGVRRTGQAAPSPGGAPRPSPEDAPVLLVTTRPVAAADQPRIDGSAPTSTDPLEDTKRNLEGYQRQLRGLMDTLSRSASATTGASTGMPPAGLSALAAPGPIAAAPASLFGGQLQGSGTARVAASLLGNRSLTLPKGTAFTCALKTRVISATSGLVGCQVQRNVYGDDGRVLLIERGSHLDGEYRVASLRPGTVRIPVLWTRVRTPNGVTVDIDSPGTGKLGESGIEGHVDNRWVERIGAAMLLSLIDDSVKLMVHNSSDQGSGNTVVLPSTTANTSKLAEKVLDSTINIPPLIQQNQGGVVGIYVARDVDFSSVYELQPAAMPARPAP